MNLLWNIVLAFVWSALMGEISLVNLAVGFGLGFFFLAGLARMNILVDRRYAATVWLALAALARFFRELIVANIRVLLLVLNPTKRVRPGIVAVPLEDDRPGTVALVANLVTLTPGTVSVDVSDDGKTLFVHTIQIEPNDRDAVCDGIKTGIERPIRRLVQGDDER